MGILQRDKDDGDINGAFAAIATFVMPDHRDQGRCRLLNQ